MAEEQNAISRKNRKMSRYQQRRGMVSKTERRQHNKDDLQGNLYRELEILDIRRRNRQMEGNEAITGRRMTGNQQNSAC